jgi:hypothetical protein
MRLPDTVLAQVTNEEDILQHPGNISAVSSKGILADHLLPRRNRGRKVAQIEVAARTLLDHQLLSPRKTMRGDGSDIFPCSLTLCRYSPMIPANEQIVPTDWADHLALPRH